LEPLKTVKEGILNGLFLLLDGGVCRTAKAKLDCNVFPEELVDAVHARRKGEQASYMCTARPL